MIFFLLVFSLLCFLILLEFNSGTRAGAPGAMGADAGMVDGKMEGDGVSSAH